jgi:hypothetical protein
VCSCWQKQKSPALSALAFGVWGYSTFETVDTDVFLNQEVKYNGTTSAWEYSPLKYWDTRSSYEFYAYYPYDPNVT